MEFLCVKRRKNYVQVKGKKTENQLENKLLLSKWQSDYHHVVAKTSRVKKNDDDEIQVIYGKWMNRH